MILQGNLSFYCISMPVTAKRKQTAIVPLLQSEMVGQKVVLYDGTIRCGVSSILVSHLPTHDECVPASVCWFVSQSYLYVNVN